MRHDTLTRHAAVPDVVELERALYRLRHSLDEVQALLDGIAKRTVETVYLEQSVWLGPATQTAAGTSD